MHELPNGDARIAELEGHAKRRSLQTLLALEKSQFSLKRTGNESSHVKGTREEAIAIEKRFTTINLEEKKDQTPSDAASKILLRVVNQRCGPPLEFMPVPCATEADVASIVNDVLHDAIAILNHLEIDIEGLGACQERSLFSGRPDILVVRSSTHQLPLLVIEVKKPIVDGHLCDKQKALGQAYDYAESLRARGRPEPVVVLTTVAESCVCWNSEDEDDKTGGRYANAIGIASTCQPAPQKQKASSTSASATPPMLRSPDSSATRSISRDELDNVFEPASSREFNRSKVFEAHQLAHALCAALCRAFCSTPAKDKSIYHLRPESSYFFSNVLRFAAEGGGYAWGTLKVCVGAPTPSRRRKTSKNARSAKSQNPIDGDACAYYLIGRLGYGATSNVWRALDWAGNEVVVKARVKATNKMGHALDSESSDSEAKRATEEEVGKLKCFYEFLEGKVHYAKLSGFHCVVMPFFRPVPKKDRKASLEAVKAVLMGAFYANKLRHDDEDVRWSHIGTYTEASNAGAGTIYHVLRDLADLAPAEDNTSFVDAHLNILEMRMGQEPEPTPEQFLCEEVAKSEDEIACKTTGD